MRPIRLCAAAMAVGGVIWTAGFGGSTHESKLASLPVVVSWHGTSKLELRKLRPQSGYIADSKAWKELWRAWRPTEQVPTVDFREAIVLVVANNNQNKLRVAASLDDAGALQLTHIMTPLLYFEPKDFFYQLALIRREGIKTIGGQMLEKPHLPSFNDGPFAPSD